MRELLSRLKEDDAAQVQDIWDALLMARRDCEAMAARGVRVSRDISRDWQETVSDLIDRVVAQDSELGQLRQQVRWCCRMGRLPVTASCCHCSACWSDLTALLSCHQNNDTDALLSAMPSVLGACGIACQLKPIAGLL